MQPLKMTTCDTNRCDLKSHLLSGERVRFQVTAFKGRGKFNSPRIIKGYHRKFPFVAESDTLVRTSFYFDLLIHPNFCDSIKY